MGFQISGDDVNDNRKGIFASVNVGGFTTTSNVSNATEGTVIWDTYENNLKVYNGNGRWSSLSAPDITIGIFTQVTITKLKEGLQVESVVVSSSDLINNGYLMYDDEGAQYTLEFNGEYSITAHLIGSGGQTCDSGPGPRQGGGGGYTYGTISGLAPNVLTIFTGGPSNGTPTSTSTPTANSRMGGGVGGESGGSAAGDGGDMTVLGGNIDYDDRLSTDTEYYLIAGGGGGGSSYVSATSTVRPNTPSDPLDAAGGGGGNNPGIPGILYYPSDGINSIGGGGTLAAGGAGGSGGRGNGDGAVGIKYKGGAGGAGGPSNGGCGGGAGYYGGGGSDGAYSMAGGGSGFVDDSSPLVSDGGGEPGIRGSSPTTAKAALPGAPPTVGDTNNAGGVFIIAN